MNAAVNNLPRQPPINSSGFTLIELMVTVAVLAIIVSIAAPSISTQLANQRVKSTTATISNALKEAKVESIIRRQNVEVIYDATTTPKTVTLRAINTLPADNVDISVYNITDKSTIDITPSSTTVVTFQPNKVIAGNDEVIYTICDSGSGSETPKQVILTKIANINTVNAGSC